MGENQKQLKRLHSYRWIVWATLLTAYMVVVFQRLSLNAVSFNLQQEFNLSASGFAMIASAFPYSYLIMQIPVGIAVDYLGQRRTAAAGVLLGAAGSILFSFSHSVWMLFLARLLVGTGSATVFLCLLKVMINWFYSKEFATISGINQVFANMGGVFAQTPLVLLVGCIGWRVTYEIIAGLCLVIALAILLLVRDSPSDMGLPSIESLEGRKEAHVADTNIRKALTRVLVNMKIYPVVISYGIIYGSFVTFTGVWGIKYLMESSYGMEMVTAGNYSISVTLGIAIGSLIVGKVSDMIKKRKLLLIITSFIGVIAWALFTFVKIPAGGPLHIAAFMIGLSSAYALVSIAYTKEINDERFSGIAVSIANFGGILGTAVIPVVIGMVYDANQHLSIELIWHKCMGLLLVLNIVAFLFSFLTKETNGQNIFSDSKNISV